ncbi:MAG: hypothetical protein CL855_02080 [Cryomorphaceae bacterium]|nr:hypothetical protein [Cryomorphaceae bacterium]
MAFCFDDNLISDLHKDVYGFRPRQGFMQKWNGMNKVHKQLLWDELCDTLDENIKADGVQAAEALVNLRKNIRSKMNSLKCNWKLALRLLIVNERCDPECDQDFGYALWRMDIGYEDSNNILKLYRGV